MTDEIVTEKDGPAAALSILYEASDLLKAMRLVDTEGRHQMEAGAWTLSGEVKRRLDTAIGHLDDSLDGAEPNASGNGKSSFNDRHYMILAGIIGTWRPLFREINEPDNRQAIEDLSCGMDALVDNLAAALGREGGTA